MKNPLRKRLLRELKNDIGKYLVIFSVYDGDDWLCVRFSRCG